MRSRLIATAALAAAVAVPSMAQQNPPPAPRARSAATIRTNAAYLGIGVQDVDAERAKALNLKEVRGAEVKSVATDSPASKAGLKEGDVVLEYNGQPVEGREQLARLVQETPVGRAVRIGVWRGGASQTLTATIEAGKGMTLYGGNWPGEITMPEIKIPPMPQMDMPRFQMSFRNPALGIIGEPLGEREQLAEFFGVKEGVLVVEVTKDSAAEKAGLKAGDVITKVDDTRVNTPRDITTALRANRSKKTVNVTVIRSKKEMQLPVTVETATTGTTIRARTVRLPAMKLQPLPVFRLLQLNPTDRII